MIDFEIPWTVEEIEAAKAEVLTASGLQDAYVRAVAWRGQAKTWASLGAQPGPPGHRRLGVGAYYGDAKMKGAKLDISKWKRPSPETIPATPRPPVST